jgi:hypothetical protein
VSAFAPASAVQWGTYEVSKGLLFPLFQPLAGTGYIQPEVLATAVSGAIAGICAVCANNPLEFMRIRLQLLESRSKKDAETIKRGYWRLGLSILQKEGIGGNMKYCVGMAQNVRY